MKEASPLTRKKILVLSRSLSYVLEPKTPERTLEECFNVPLLLIRQKSDNIDKSGSTVRRVYVKGPSNNVPRESETAMSKKKQVAKKVEHEAKRPEPKEAQEGCQCCTGHSTTKIPRTFFVQKL